MRTEKILDKPSVCLFKPHVQCLKVQSNSSRHGREEKRSDPDQLQQAFFFTDFCPTPTNGFAGFLSLGKKSLSLETIS